MKNQPVSDLVIELKINTYQSAEVLWNALTDSDELANWWSEKVVLQTKKGGLFKEPWEDDQGQKQLAQGKVIDLKKNQFITFSWSEKSWPGKAQTFCTFAIEDQGKTRQLKVTHQGWESLPEKLQKATMREFKVGWTYHLKELKSYLDD